MSLNQTSGEYEGRIPKRDMSGLRLWTGQVYEGWTMMWVKGEGRKTGEGTGSGEWQVKTREDGAVPEETWRMTRVDTMLGNDWGGENDW